MTGGPDVRYTRIYADEEGSSHFEDVVVDTTPMYVVAGLPNLNLSAPMPATGVVFVHVPRDTVDMEWHVAPRRQFVVLLGGEAEVETSDGEIRRFAPGAIVLVEDTVGDGHLTTVVGTEDCRWLFVPLAPPA